MNRPQPRPGLTIAEYLRLPAGASKHDEPRRLLAAARAAWPDDGAGGRRLPRSLAHWSATSLDREVGQRCTDSAKDWVNAIDWLQTAYRRFPAATVSPGSIKIRPWRLELLQVLAAPIALARDDAQTKLRDAAPSAVAATCRWLNEPPLDVLEALTGAFVLDMHASRPAATATAQADDRVNAFAAHLLAVRSDPLSFLDRYPLLARFAVTSCRTHAVAAVEFGRRFASDESELAAWLGLADVTVDQVEPGQGDRHRDGRTVARVRFESSNGAQATVAYKPSSVATAAWIMSGRCPNAMRLPELLPRAGYGWMRWIDPPGPAVEATVQAHYRGLGELSAIAWLFGATDLHAENILPGADGPVVVDVETLLSPMRRHREAGHTHPAPGIVLESPVNTGILPTRVELGPGQAFDASPFGVGAGGDSALMVTDWADPGTSHMHATQSLSPPLRDQLVGVDGSEPDPFRYLDIVTEASAATYETMVREHDAWSTFLDTPAPANASVRVLLRDTALYSRIRQYLTHPAVLHNPFLADAAFDLLDPSVIHDDLEYQETVVAAERAALLRGDVPAFTTRINSVDLELDDGTVLTGFFKLSPRNRARAHAHRLTREQEALNWVTMASLRAAHTNRLRERDYDTCCAELPPERSKGRDRVGEYRQLLVDTAVAAADRVQALSVEGDDGQVSWLTLRVDEDSNWRPVAADRDLYAGSLGIQLFFEAITACDLATQQHRQLLDRLRGQRAEAPPAVSGAGVFLGAAGDLLVELFLQRLNAPGGNRPLRSLLEAVDAPADGPDVLVGAAGSLVVLGQLARQLPALREPAQAVAARHLCDVLDAAQEQDSGLAWPVNGELNVGFAHGASGIGLALTDYANWSTESPAAAAALAAATAAEQWVESSFEPGVGNWPDLRASNDAGFSTSWCNGSTGIGVASAAGAALATPTGGWRRDLRRALSSAFPDGLGHGQGLCHGDLAVAELLHLAGTAVGEYPLQERAVQVAAMVALQLRRDRGIARLDWDQPLDVPGLMHGVAGIGYQMLRLLHPNVVPSLLTLGLAA